ncbi:MAG TPA: hypothetical protein VGS04_03715 [Nitrososphaerales archaeon]|nr:hypothetical protein [Nitrososphaerales archaeon]
MERKFAVFRFRHGRGVLAPLLVSAATLFLLGAAVAPAHALGVPLYSINQTQSGLVASDPLTATLSQSQLAGSSFWIFGGDAVAEGAPYAFSEDSGGLHIGVQATANANYAGFYALHRANAMLAHATVTAPSSTVPSGYPNVGLYVQTGGVNVDYVYCGPVTASYGTYWQVDLATGNPNQAFQFQVLYYDSSANQALTRDCTIVTNGNNYLAVYLDGAQVYQASNLNLEFQQPFQFFLETQTSYAGAMFTGTFNNFYLTSGDSVTVTGMPSGSTAQLVSPSGAVLASAAENSGTATLPIGHFNMPLTANIRVTSLLGISVASTKSPISIWGGDSYSLSLLGGGLLGGSQNPASSTGQAAPSVSGAVQAVAAPASGAVSQVGVATPQSTSAPLPVDTTTTSPLVALSLVGVAGFVMHRDSDLVEPHKFPKESKSSSFGREEQH